MNFRLTTLKTPNGEKTICRAEELDEQLTQGDWFDMLESLCAEEFDAIEFKTTRDSLQDRGERHGEPYIATKAQALAYIAEWHKYLEDEAKGLLQRVIPNGVLAYESIDTSKKVTDYKPPVAEYDKTNVVGWRTVYGRDGKMKVNEPIYAIKKWN